MYLQNKTPEETGLEIGKTYWMYMVSNGMASTCKYQITIKDISKKESYAQYRNLLLIRFREKGKRKDVGLYLKKSMLFLESGAPLLIDTDFSSFSMNACMNFVTEFPESLRNFILKFNRYKFADFGIMTYGLKNSHDSKILFPDKADISHAVIRRIAEIK